MSTSNVFCMLVSHTRQFGLRFRYAELNPYVFQRSDDPYIKTQRASNSVIVTAIDNLQPNFGSKK